jgi:hypothetical protein
LLFGDSLMKKHSFCLQCTILYILLMFLYNGMAFGSENVKRKLEWKTDFEIETYLASMPNDLEPSLPAPALYPEPEYTWGFSNTIFWNRDSIENAVTALDMHLLFYEVQATFDNIILWAFPKASVDSATFTNPPDGLPEGISIDYRLRYYAEDSAHNYSMSYWSEPESSIQDASPPNLWHINVLHLQETEGLNWAIGPTVHVDVIASDYSFGKVMQVVIHEKSESCDDIIYYPILPPTDSINQAIPYTMCSPQREVAELSVWVLDVAGQPSEAKSISLFWWPYEGEENKMVCFPNPFNPQEGEITIIKVDDPGINRVRIFDPFGNLVKLLVKKASSDIFFEWDGRNERGDIVASGGYLCVVEGNMQLYCKIAVIK